MLVMMITTVQNAHKQWVVNKKGSKMHPCVMPSVRPAVEGLLMSACQIHAPLYSALVYVIAEMRYGAMETAENANATQDKSEKGKKDEAECACK